MNNYPDGNLSEVEFLLLPQKKLIERLGKIPEEMPETWYYGGEWWDGFPVPAEELFQAIFPGKRTVIPLYEKGDQMVVWGGVQKGKHGATKGNRITLSFRERRFEDIDICFDLLEEYTSICKFAEQAVSLAIQLECVFYSIYTERMTLPDYERISEELKQSRAQQFVDDPKQFLKDQGF